MKLIENAVRGQVQVPPGAAEQHPAALDLVRRILVSSPQQRCKLPAVMAHPWFQVRGIGVCLWPRHIRIQRG